MHLYLLEALSACALASPTSIQGASDEPRAAVPQSRTSAEAFIPLGPRPAWMLVPADEPLRAGGDVVLVGETSVPDSEGGRTELSGSLRLALGDQRAVELPSGERRTLPASHADALELLRDLHPELGLVALHALPRAPAGDAAATSFDTALRGIRVQLAVDGDAAQALELCETLLFGASNASLFEEQERVLAAIALERARTLALLGDSKAALAAATEVLLQGPRPAAPQDGVAVPADAALLAIAGRAAESPELVALRHELEADLGAQRRRDEGASEVGVRSAPAQDEDSVAAYVRERFGSASADLDQIVRNLVAYGNEQEISQIGRSAAPTLATLVLRDLDRDESRAKSSAGYQASDPLVLLWHIDPEGATALIADHLDEGGFGWRLRLLEALEKTAVLSSNRDIPYWNLRRHHQPVWLAVLTRLLESPDTTRRATPFVRSAAFRDALTPALVEAIESVVRSAEEQTADQLLAELEPGWRLATAVPLWERLLDHPRPAVRARAVRALGQFEPTARLLSAASDPAPEVRAELARSLAHRKVSESMVATGRPPERSQLKFEPVTASEAALQVLDTLLGDAVPSVRDAAFEAWKSLPDEQLRSLLPSVAEHMTPAQRAEVVDQLGATTGAGARALVGFANDPDPGVVAAVDEELLERPVSRPEYLALLRLRLADRERPFGFRARGGQSAVRGAIDFVARTEGLSALLAGCQAQGDWRWLEPLEPEVLRHLFARAERSELRALDPAELESLARWAVRGGYLREHGSPLVTIAWDPRGVPVLRALALDSSLPGEGRLELLRLALGHSLGADPELARAVLLDLDFEAEPGLATSDSLLALRPQDAAGVALALELGDAPLPPRALWRLEAGFDVAAPGARELRDRILARWRERGEGLPEAIVQALEALALDDAAAVDPELLLAAAREPELVAGAVRAMGKLRDPRYLPALERALLGEGVLAAMPEEERGEVQVSAITALTSYMSPAAAQVLRLGLRIERDGRVVLRGGYKYVPLHELVQEALDRIHRYHEEEARWAAGSAPLERRDAARELVALLASPEPAMRAEAARSLATLRAIEALPKLIPLLGDPDPAVRAAVRAALDELHAHEPNEP